MRPARHPVPRSRCGCLGATRISLHTLALIPGTSAVLGGGDTHSASDPGTAVVGVIVEYQIWSARTTARSG